MKEVSPTEDLFLEDFGGEVRWVNFEEKTLTVSRWELAGCGCCSEPYEHDLLFHELSDQDFADLMAGSFE